MNFIKAYRSDRSPLTRLERVERVKKLVPDLESLIEKIKAGEVIDIAYFYHHADDNRETPVIHGWRTLGGGSFMLMLTELLTMISGDGGQRAQSKFLELATALRNQRFKQSIQRFNKLFNK